jgi:hypothetical protein
VEGSQLTYSQSDILDTLLITTATSGGGGLEQESASALCQRLAKDSRSSAAFRSHLSTLESVSVLRTVVDINERFLLLQKFTVLMQV